MYKNKLNYKNRKMNWKANNNNNQLKNKIYLPHLLILNLKIKWLKKNKQQNFKNNLHFNNKEFIIKPQAVILIVDIQFLWLQKNLQQLNQLLK